MDLGSSIATLRLSIGVGARIRVDPRNREALVERDERTHRASADLN